MGVISPAGFFYGVKYFKVFLYFLYEPLSAPRACVQLATRHKLAVAWYNMSSALQVDPDIGLQEILDISQSDRYSIQYSPFLQGPGGQLGGTIIRNAAPWKGLSMDELAEQFPDVHAGLENAIEMAEDQEDVGGFAVIEQEGQVKVMTQAAANLAQEGDTGATAIRENLTSQQQALQVYKEESGTGIRRPQIA